MNITNIKFRRIFDTEPLKAVLSVTLDDAIAIHDIKLVSANGKLFVVMPSKKRSDGTFSDIVHPINADTRARMEKNILDAYRETRTETPKSDAE